jgi:FKBP-type peptidyl-prolyl cis-trans isomerase FklB
MRKLSFMAALCLAAFVFVSSCTSQTQSPKANLKTDADSLSYALGVSIASAQLAQYVEQSVDSAYINDFIKGFNEGILVNKDDKKASAHALGQQVGQSVGGDIQSMNQYFFGDDSTKTITTTNLAAGVVSTLLKKKLLIEAESADAYIEGVQKSLFAKQHATEKEANAKFLEENQTKEGVVTLASGLQYKVVTEGTGAKPTAESTVNVAYKGSLTDGTVFDSNENIDLSLQGVIQGWTEGIQLMSVGSKYILYVPYDLAYGEQGNGSSIGPYATLIFEVTLHSIVTQ